MSESRSRGEETRQQGRRAKARAGFDEPVLHHHSLALPQTALYILHTADANADTPKLGQRLPGCCGRSQPPVQVVHVWLLYMGAIGSYVHTVRSLLFKITAAAPQLLPSPRRWSIWPEE